MQVFVTGASGWIGSAAVDELLADGHAGFPRVLGDAAAGPVQLVEGVPLGGIGSLGNIGD